MSDFMLIAHASNGEPAACFDERMQSLRKSLSNLLPKIEWQIEFNLGCGKYVEVFSAPNLERARDVSRVARENGVRAEVTPLRRGW